VPFKFYIVAIFVIVLYTSGQLCLLSACLVLVGHELQDKSQDVHIVSRFLLHMD